MTTAKLEDLRSAELIARFFGIPAHFFVQYANSGDQRSYYREINIAKSGKNRRGEFRIVYAAHSEMLSSFHRSVAMVIANSVTFGDHVQGFLRGRSTRTNAQQHLASAVVLHADVKNFFDSISLVDVCNTFIRYGMNPEIAQLVASCCTIDGALRQGTRCSPIIANIVCTDLDQAFLTLAGSLRCVYTRYADDITFSGEVVPSDQQIKVILNSYRFSLRDGRCFRQRRGRSQFVTGLTVADEDMPRLPKRLKRRLRLIIHYIEKNGLRAHFLKIDERRRGDAERWLKGILQYAVSVEPERVSNWLAIYDNAVAEERVGS